MERWRRRQDRKLESPRRSLASALAVSRIAKRIGNRCRARVALQTFDGQGYGVAAAQAQRGDAALQIAALEFVEERDQDARAGGAYRVADGYGATVHIYFFGI